MNISSKIDVIKRHLTGLEFACSEGNKIDIESEWVMIQEKMGELKKLLNL